MGTTTKEHFAQLINQPYLFTSQKGSKCRWSNHIGNGMADYIALPGDTKMHHKKNIETIQGLGESYAVPSPSKSALRIASDIPSARGSKCPAPVISWYWIQSSFWAINRCSVAGTSLSSSPCQIWTEDPPSLFGKGFSTSIGSNSQVPKTVIRSRWTDSNSPCCVISAWKCNHHFRLW